MDQATGLERQGECHCADRSGLEPEVVCAGDSGGAVMQTGKLVGIVSQVRRQSPYWVVGTEFHTVPIQLIMELAEE